MYLEDSEEEIELIVKFIKSKKVTFDESKNQVYWVNDESYLLKPSTITHNLKRFLEQKRLK
jgi:hypothetical protein